jgi:hypothetical protein
LHGIESWRLAEGQELVTGLHNFYWLMNMVNGAPLIQLNFTALLGSVALMSAAATLPFRPHMVAKIELVALLLLWVYYAPLITISVFEPFTTREEFRRFISDEEYFPLVGMILGPALLIACTTISAFFSLRHRESRRVTENPT